MREIDVKQVTDAVAKCCVDSCYYLPDGVLTRLEQAVDKEESPLGRQVLDTIIENAKLATAKSVPLCQDTGLTVVYIDIGQDVHLRAAICGMPSTGAWPGAIRKGTCGNRLSTILFCA